MAHALQRLSTGSARRKTIATAWTQRDAGNGHCLGCVRDVPGEARGGSAAALLAA